MFDKIKIISCIVCFTIIFSNINCAVVKLPYKAVKTGYKATKTVVKGAAAVGDALVPDGDDKEKKDETEKK